jgi:hypothetical protein
VSVCLTGSLDDFSIQDILQIIAIGGKTGCLSIETEATGGAIVFRRGRVVASLDDRRLPLQTEMRTMRGCSRDEVLRRRIVASLERFASSRRGDFSFRCSTHPPRVVDGRDIAEEILEGGMEVVELLLEMTSGPQPVQEGCADGTGAAVGAR